MIFAHDFEIDMTPLGSAHSASSKIPGFPRAAYLFTFVLILLTGCSYLPYRSASVPSSISGGGMRGEASWYGRPFHGRKTANGERYNMNALTAAHRTLPFGTWVRVKRLDTGKHVDVRINDRGPFIAGRIIDLSRKAASRLNMISSGVAPVSVSPIRSFAKKSSRWFVLIGGFSNRNEAQAFATRMSRRNSRINRGWNGNSEHYHVRLDGFSNKEKAVRMASRLRRKGYGAFIVRSR